MTTLERGRYTTPITRVRRTGGRDGSGAWQGTEERTTLRASLQPDAETDTDTVAGASARARWIAYVPVATPMAPPPLRAGTPNQPADIVILPDGSKLEVVAVRPWPGHVRAELLAES